MAIALGVASDALARDPPNQGRKAGRIAANARPVDRIAPAPQSRVANRPGGARGRNGHTAAATAFPHNGAPNAFLHHQEARRAELRREFLQARSRLPQHPLPGERGFTGVPPPRESTTSGATTMVIKQRLISRERETEIPNAGPSRLKLWIGPTT